MPKKYTTSEFIEKAKQIHGDIYDYSEVDYVHSKEKVKIFCKNCKAYFWQIPNSHLLGSGCKKCHTGEVHLTKEEFIKKVNIIHGNKYDYSEVEWIDSNTKIKIKCKKCNKIFLQSPHNHLYGQGCAHCAYSLSIEEFIKKARTVHGNKYDYTDSIYSGINKAITIKCNNCGKNFTQLAISHLKGGKCPFCTKRIKSVDYFIKKARKIHGNNYNYDQVIYRGSETKVKIYCNKCKHTFEQKPTTHLRGSGCPYCNKNKKLTAEEFIKKAKEVHGNKYNYDDVIYLNTCTKVKIFCNNCYNHFEQTPHGHLSGAGCRHCANILHKKQRTSTKDIFIKKAMEIHNRRYNYDKVIYKNARNKIEIFCNKCKKYFWQTPHSHLSGSGCPFCAASKGEMKIQDWLIAHKVSFISQKRFKDCRDKLPLPFDFYLPAYNICIEFQGPQHYDLAFFIGKYKKRYSIAKNMFEILKKHDKIKQKYCKKNNIYKFG